MRRTRADSRAMLGNVVNQAEQPESATARRTRIAFCVTDLDPGGAERALAQLVTRLDRECWDPVVLSLSAGGALRAELEEAGVPVVCLGARHAWNVMVLPRLVRELRRWRPALLQTWLHHANIAGRVAARLAGVRIVVSGIRVAERRGRWRLRVDRWTDRLVLHHVCVSRGVAEFSIREGGLPAGKVSVIPNGVDFERWASAHPADLAGLGIRTDVPLVLFVGRLDLQKDPLTLLEAVAALRSEFPELQTLFVGDGPLRDLLAKEIRSRGLGAQVRLAGWRGDVPNVMRRAALVAVPSRWEGMPNVVLEAMAAGRPVVATAVEGVTELIAPERTGLLFTVGSARELAEKIRQILSNPPLAEELGRSSQDFVREGFTWEATVAGYERLYYRLLGRPA